MSKPFYPSLDEKNIKLVLGLFAANPDYFNNPECPYSPEVKELFEGNNRVLDYDTHQKPIEHLDDNQILQEISDLHHKLKAYWEDVKSSEKAADKNTFFRVATALLERIVNLREQMSNVTKVNSFISETLQIMEQVLTPDQRNEVLERLKKFGMGE